jgi:hypothetical protein
MPGRIRHPKQLAEALANARAQAAAATDPDVAEHFERIAAECEARLDADHRCRNCGSKLEDDLSKERRYGSDCFARLTTAGALRGDAGTYDPHEGEDF